MGNLSRRDLLIGAGAGIGVLILSSKAEAREEVIIPGADIVSPADYSDLPDCLKKPFEVINAPGRFYSKRLPLNLISPSCCGEPPEYLPIQVACSEGVSEDSYSDGTVSIGWPGPFGVLRRTGWEFTHIVDRSLPGDEVVRRHGETYLKSRNARSYVECYLKRFGDKIFLVHKLDADSKYGLDFSMDQIISGTRDGSLEICIEEAIRNNTRRPLMPLAFIPADMCVVSRSPPGGSHLYIRPSTTGSAIYAPQMFLDERDRDNTLKRN